MKCLESAQKLAINIFRAKFARNLKKRIVKFLYLKCEIDYRLEFLN